MQAREVLATPLPRRPGRMSRTAAPRQGLTAHPAGRAGSGATGRLSQPAPADV